MPIINATFRIECKGRNVKRQEVLKEPVNVRVEVWGRSNSDTIEINVHCPHNTEGHGQRCKASHPGRDKVGKGIHCAYSLDLPHAMDIAKF